MPYAANGVISTDEIEGGIEITDEQYAAAIAGIIEGKIISIDGGFSIDEPPEPEDPEPPVVDPNAPYIIGKSTPWRRMTDAEAVAVDAAFQAAPLKQRRIYEASSYISTGDELFGTLKALLTAALSAKRADELLAKET